MGIVDVFFPKVCVGCKREGGYICPECQKKLVRPEQICPMCCRPSLDGWTHPRCKTSEGMERLVVGLPYKGMVQQCLKKVKYKNAWGIVGFLWGIWRTRVSSDLRSFHPGDVVTSVPMWRGKERERGFNQAEILANLIAEEYKGRILVMLERMRETRPMFGLDRQKRRENIQNAFAISDTVSRDTVTRVILVDDVWTTGATMRECAKMLKINGARVVWGITLAR